MTNRQIVVCITSADDGTVRLSYPIPANGGVHVPSVVAAAMLAHPPPRVEIFVEETDAP